RRRARAQPGAARAEHRPGCAARADTAAHRHELTFGFASGAQRRKVSRGFIPTNQRALAMGTRFSSASAVLLLGVAVSLQAQVPAHKHYEQTEGFDKPAASGALAPRLMNVGKHVFLVSTKSEQAQRFMSQGVNLAYGFNHAEAGRAFAEA